MKELHHDVEVEPPLQPLTGETFHHRSANTDPDARADLRVKGSWIDSRNAFFDTRVFYLHASSYRSKSLPSLYRRFEGEKKRCGAAELAFSLARSAIRCVRGSRSVRRRRFDLAPVDLVQAEVRLARH